MIRIGQASGPEVAGKFGTPPNQLRTGVTKAKPYGNLDGELNIAQFHSGFTAVYRCTDSGIADKMATYVEHAVMNWQGVGYGQQWIDDKYTFTGLFDWLMEHGETDPLKCTKPVNVSCATLLGGAAYFAGIYEPKLRILNTYDEEAWLMGTGKFVKLTDPDLLTVGRGCRRGDILHRIGHTAIVLDDDLTEATEPRRIGNCYKCNLRTGPGKENSVIREMDSGEIVELISTASNGWGQVKAGKDIGYVAGQYLTELAKAKAAGNVWLRKSAGDTSKAAEIIVIPVGSVVRITGAVKKVGLTPWYETWFTGKHGWASGKYIKPCN